MDLINLQKDLVLKNAQSVLEIKDLLLPIEKDILGIGNTRIAVLLNQDQVAKLAFKPTGLFHNQFEANLYQYAKSIKQENLLAPVIDYQLDGLLIQARCLPVKFQAVQEHLDLINDLSRLGVTDVGVNLGIYQERLVCYDYSVPSPELFFKVENFLR
jgi:hypothetical protein